MIFFIHRFFFLPHVLFCFFFLFLSCVLVTHIICYYPCCCCSSYSFFGLFLSIYFVHLMWNCAQTTKKNACLLWIPWAIVSWFINLFFFHSIYSLYVTLDDVLSVLFICCWSFVCCVACNFFFSDADFYLFCSVLLKSLFI